MTAEHAVVLHEAADGLWEVEMDGRVLGGRVGTKEQVHALIQRELDTRARIQQVRRELDFGIV